MEFKGTIKNGGLAFADSILKQRQELLQSLAEGSKIVEVIKKHRSTKTQKQLGYLFGLVLEKAISPAIRNNGYMVSRELSRTTVDNKDIVVVQQVPFPMGFSSRDVLDRLLYPWCGVYNEEGELIRLSQMFVDEAVRFVENIKHMATDNLKTDIPEANEEWYLTFKERPNDL